MKFSEIEKLEYFNYIKERLSQFLMKTDTKNESVMDSRIKRTPMTPRVTCGSPYRDDRTRNDDHQK